MSNPKFSNLKVGEVLSETQFYVVEKLVGENVQVKPDSGESIILDKKYAEQFLTSASQILDADVKITKTEAAAKFIGNPNVAMTVNFNKQVKEADLVKEIQDAYDSSTPKEFSERLKKGVKKGMNGEERTMIGRHFGSVDDFGRVQFIDMEISKGANKNYDERLRLVDPRTINWFILRGVKYIVK
jgi:hypothetical protein